MARRALTGQRVSESASTINGNPAFANGASTGFKLDAPWAEGKGRISIFGNSEAMIRSRIERQNTSSPRRKTLLLTGA